MTPEEFNLRVLDEIDKLAEKYKGQPMSQEEAIAHLVFFTVVLHKGFYYGTNEFGILFEFAINQLEKNCGVVRLPVTEGLPS